MEVEAACLKHVGRIDRDGEESELDVLSSVALGVSCSGRAGSLCSMRSGKALSVKGVGQIDDATERRVLGVLGSVGTLGVLGSQRTLARLILSAQCVNWGDGRRIRFDLPLLAGVDPMSIGRLLITCSPTVCP